MEWGIVALAILALPVMAIVAFAKSVTNERERRRVEERVNLAQRELSELSGKIEALRTGIRTPGAESLKAAAPETPQDVADRERRISANYPRRDLFPPCTKS